MAAKKKRKRAAKVASRKPKPLTPGQKGWVTRRRKEAERQRKLEERRAERAKKKRERELEEKRAERKKRDAKKKKSEASKKSWRTRRGGDEVKKRLAVVVRMREEGKESRDIKRAHEVYYDAKQDLRASTNETEYMRILRRISLSLRLDRLGWDILY